jgi:iron complex transport system ATP-binding protein
MTGYILSFREVAFGYRHLERPVLRDISLDVPEGSITALIGPNGAGKTTILHLALGWLRARAGKVLLEGKQVHAYGQRERGRLMSLVPQKEHIPFEYSIFEYVMLGRAPHLRALEMPGPEDYEAAAEAIEAVGLAGSKSRPINELSSGERQLLLAARSLAQRPRLMLLDEPTSHLDMGNKKRLVELIESQRSGGVTVLFTTHELDIAARLADHLVLVHGGEVLRSGSPDEVLADESLKAAYGLDVKVVEVEGWKKIVLWR